MVLKRPSLIICWELWCPIPLHHTIPHTCHQWQFFIGAVIVAYSVHLHTGSLAILSCLDCAFRLQWWPYDYQIPWENIHVAWCDSLWDLRGIKCYYPLWYCIQALSKSALLYSPDNPDLKFSKDIVPEKLVFHTAIMQLSCSSFPNLLLLETFTYEKSHLVITSTLCTHGCITELLSKQIWPSYIWDFIWSRVAWSRVPVHIHLNYSSSPLRQFTLYSGCVHQFYNDTRLCLGVIYLVKVRPTSPGQSNLKQVACTKNWCNNWYHEAVPDGFQYDTFLDQSK